MNYIWEVLIKASEQGFPREKIRFAQSKTVSPYMEVAFEELNREYLDGAPVEVNAYYRHSAVFDNVLNGFDDCPEFRDGLFDILMQYVAETNMREGLCRDEYYGLFLRGDVSAGRFGRQFTRVFDTFGRRQARFVTECMVRLYKLGASIALLRSVMRQLYPRSIIYLDSVDRRELLVYIGKKETPELREQVGFLVSLFVPFDYVTHLFWDMHFGIIGVDETMGIDECMLY